jgi:putative colanic acid biosynthesis glycosyltransferase WcaI
LTEVSFRKMNILILGLNYLPESTSIGPYTADLAEYLKARQHDVRVVTGFPAAPQWKVQKGYEGKWFMHDTVNGVPVFRTYAYIPKNPRNALRRILFDTSFSLSALAAIFRGKRPDVVVVISPPLQLGITALLLARRRSRVVLQIQDLVPDAAVAVGALRPGGRAVRIAQALERFVYRKVDRIGVICEGMRQNLIGKGVPAEKLALLPNYVDLSFIRSLPSKGPFRLRFGISAEQFVVMYSGSVSGKQGLQTFVEAGEALEQDDDVACCLIGDGTYLPELKALAQERSMQRFRFLPLQPRESLSEQLSAADVLVITQRKEVRDMVFPGKLLYYMASGRAILAAVSEDSETGKFIRENEVGIVVPPENPDELVKAIRWMRDHSDQVRRLGRNGRLAAEARFDRGIVLGEFAELLEGRVVESGQVYA